jgi:hypothetical protein
MSKENSMDENWTSTADPLATWSPAEARRRIAAARKLVVAHEAARGISIPSNARLEVGERFDPQYITGPAGTKVFHADLWESDLQEFMMPKDIRTYTYRDGTSRDAQPMGVGYVCHLYFTGPGQWGELIDVVTVWLGDNLNGPQVIG